MRETRATGATGATGATPILFTSIVRRKFAADGIRGTKLPLAAHVIGVR